MDKKLRLATKQQDIKDQRLFAPKAWLHLEAALRCRHRPVSLPLAGDGSGLGGGKVLLPPGHHQHHLLVILRSSNGRKGKGVTQEVSSDYGDV